MNDLRELTELQLDMEFQSHLGKLKANFNNPSVTDEVCEKLLDDLRKINLEKMRRLAAVGGGKVATYDRS